MMILVLSKLLRNAMRNLIEETKEFLQFPKIQPSTYNGNQSILSLPLWHTKRGRKENEAHTDILSNTKAKTE
jgi:hypothetical protein